MAITVLLDFDNLEAATRFVKAVREAGGVVTGPDCPCYPDATVHLKCDEVGVYSDIFAVEGKSVEV